MYEREEQVELWPPESSMGAKSTSPGVLSVLLTPASPFAIATSLVSGAHLKFCHFDILFGSPNRFLARTFL